LHFGAANLHVAARRKNNGSLRKHGEPIDLPLIGVVMPNGMGGIDPA
jgi:hypothetical protein